MKTALNKSDAGALRAFTESILRSFARNGDNLTGRALVDALDAGAIEPEVTRAYLALCGEA